MVIFAKSYLPGIARLLSNVTPIILLFFFTKFSTVEEVGLVNYFISIITIIGVFTDFGLPEAMQRFLPQIKDKGKIIFSAFVLEFTIVFGGLLVILGLDLIFAGEISRNQLILLLLCIFFSASHVITVTFNGLRNDFKTSLYFLGMSLSFILVTLFTYLILDIDAVESFLLGRLISWILFTIIPIIDLFRNNLFTFKFHLPKRFVTFAFNTFISAFAYALFTQWDSILVTNSLGEAENGIYKSVIFIASMPLALRVILETKLLPEYSELFAKNKLDKLKESFKKFSLILFSGAILLTLISIPIDEPVLSIFYNNEIGERSNLIFPLGLLATFLYIAAVPAISFLQAIGKENIVRNASIVQALLFVGISTLLFSNFDLYFLPALLVGVNIIFGLILILYVYRWIKD